MFQKRKRQALDNGQFLPATADTSKPTANYHPRQPRPHTVSIALPSSIIANARTHDQKCVLAGYVARALAIFCIDEVVVFEDGFQAAPSRRYDTPEARRARAAEDDKTGYTAFSDPTNFLIHLLSYLETPPYLRRVLMPFHPNLKTAGALPSVDMPHHLRPDEWCKYREGVVVENFATPRLEDHRASDSRKEKPSQHRKEHDTEHYAALADVGLDSNVTIPTAIPPGTRVTLRFEGQKPRKHTAARGLAATAVSPDAPRQQDGYFWGYSTRPASSLAKVFTECPFEGGYDFCIGTSERGKDIKDLTQGGRTKQGNLNGEDLLPKWKHLLIVFGGLAGLEIAVFNDPDLCVKGIQDPGELFDGYVSILQGQGSRTIRTEEALYIGLARLQEFIMYNETP
ncbi:MAG: hypothetical protein M1828_001704 [Chrysothrix sp. TS-e1954]|nr:MAG: hypothetical protein M1828_001704 [Chrysothrix sp. TS-e1954]